MRTTILLVIAAAGILPGTGRAQEGGAVACPSIESDSERLACYDRALRAPRAPAAAAGAQGATPAPSVTTTPPSTGAGTVAAVGAGAISTAPRTNTRNAQAPSAHAVDPNASAPIGIVPIIVASTRAVPGRGIEFTTDRGDVWFQTDGRQLSLPAAPFNARIEPSTFGGYFLVPENRQAVRVRHRE